MIHGGELEPEGSRAVNLSVHMLIPIRAAIGSAREAPASSGFLLHSFRLGRQANRFGNACHRRLQARRFQGGVHGFPGASAIAVLCAWNGRSSLHSELFPLSSELDVLRYEGLRASTAGSRTIKVNTAATAMSAAMNTLLVAQPNHSTAAAPNIVPRVPPTK